MMPVIGGRLRLGESMQRHTSWRVGGPADRFYLPGTLEDLQGFLRHFAVPPLTWIGLGSNVLVRDAGLRGTTICLANTLDQIVLAENDLLRVGAGAGAVKIAHFAAKAGLAGAEFLAGIPGTLGGCLSMNAGAHGGDTWSLVEWVEVMHPHGEIQRLSPEDFQIGYREVYGHGDACFVAAGLRLIPEDSTAVMQRLRAWQEKRAATQPLEWPSCGSVFRNPTGDHAARLIEAAGLKGKARGQAEVSSQHANFIINRGHARAADIEALVEEVQSAVQQQFGIRLQAEMRILGEAKHG
ncbi:UDP-N-acetylmuramate dehydrogenase [Acidithiobacillus thiooxidans]|uniref:UDP-N-acetylenolpyruvoylglucosamine reductase n=1 Tax=Acidithiobacillus thiooxidans ATCC 19377 TaxID=637390 RepID=A0A543Q0L7_ACITH|nr:UDP-N-acetylmuramate dehydrogenase [Acidithiobacillus thiooxidans]MDR7928127.1 UDP-N-acetylmuramate dehydrogenase [Acidithiobacillus thiooxidans]MDX5933413.1 UDP-N-acetylmuramate dehydrogenase [Acidithiobacillus thiooxidans]TQN49877.1 UDP-N-acetylenolpyruvoylglucosamine reductase [Acidithiobacillus thiooxidans ATCC 19377]